MLTLCAVLASTVVTPTGAYALAFAPPAFLPASLAGAAGVVGGTGTVGAVIGTGLVAPLDVALGGFAIGYATGLAGTAAVKWAWNWGAGGAGANTDPYYGAKVSLGGPQTGLMNPCCAWGSEPTGVGGAYGYPNLYGGLVVPVNNASYNVTFYRAGAVIGVATRSGMLYQRVQTLFFQWDIDTAPIDGILVESGGPVASWGAVPGHAPGNTPAPGPPPAVTTTPTSGCSDGSSVAGAAVHYSGATLGADLPPITYPGCPAGTYRTKATTPTTTDNGGAVVPSPLPTWTAPTVPTGFPECQPAGRCQLVLLRHGVGTTVNCTANSECAGWQTGTQRAAPTTNVRDMTTGTEVAELPRRYPNGDPLECRWGPYTLAVDECLALPTEPPPVPVPTVDAPPVPDPVPTPGSEGCFAGMSPNPMSWPKALIYSPIKCALVWAFVPSTASSASIAALRADIGNRAPVSWVGDVGGFVVGAVSGLDGAPGCFVFDVDLASLGRFHIIDSCNPADVIVKAIRPLRPLLLIAGYLAFLGPLAWWAWKSYAPLSRPNG